MIVFVTTGGDTEVAKQILDCGTEGPWAITPELARKGIGQRLYALDEKAMARDSEQ